MTEYAVGKPNWRVLVAGEDVELRGEQFSYAAMQSMTEQERRDRGIRIVTPDPIPEGKRKASPIPQNGATGPYWVLEDIPPPEPAPYTIFKTTLISRMKDAELETFDAVYRQQGLRDRMMWDNCISIISTDPYFAVLVELFTAAFGAARAKELVAPIE